MWRALDVALQAPAATQNDFPLERLNTGQRVPVTASTAGTCECERHHGAGNETRGGSAVEFAVHSGSVFPSIIHACNLV